MVYMSCMLWVKFPSEPPLLLYFKYDNISLAGPRLASLFESHFGLYLPHFFPLSLIKSRMGLSRSSSSILAGTRFLISGVCLIDALYDPLMSAIVLLEGAMGVFYSSASTVPAIFLILILPWFILPAFLESKASNWALGDFKLTSPNDWLDCCRELGRFGNSWANALSNFGMDWSFRLPPIWLVYCLWFSLMFGYMLEYGLDFE